MTKQPFNQKKDEQSKQLKETKQHETEEIFIDNSLVDMLLLPIKI